MSENTGFPGDDQPLTLKDACTQLFANAISPSTLMAEHSRGNLALEKIGRRYFVTPASIKEMRRNCLLDQPQKAPVSGYNLTARTPMEALKGQDGLFATVGSSAALDALQVTLQGLRKH